MNRWMLSLLLFVSANPVMAQEPIVAQAKAELQAAGVDLAGACGAMKLTNLVAWRVHFGLLHKAGGHRAILKADGSCLTGEQSTDPNGYATDYVIDRATGVGFDLLGDGGGANVPQWAREDAPDMVARNRSEIRDPIDPAGYLALTTPASPPDHQIEQFRLDVDALRESVKYLRGLVEALTARVVVLEGRPMPTDCRVTVFGVAGKCKLLPVQ